MKQIDKAKLLVLVVIARYDIMISIKEAIELLNYIDIDNDTKLKTITSRWPSGIRSNAEFVMPTMK